MVLKNESRSRFFILIRGVAPIFGTICVVASTFGTNTWSWFRRTQKHGFVVYLRPTATDK
jgi:hypothetical protein